MIKLWNFFRQNILKIGISFLILFIPLYPKFPSVHITHTWVYIRLEDFFIFGVVLIFAIHFLWNLSKKKFTIPIKFSFSIFLYWFFGFCSLIFSLIFIGPHLANFFPSVAALSYFRRIEYMILFFVAFSSIRSVKDLKNYLIILSITVFALSIYGFGQRFYLDLWHLFPKFFEQNPFCFPSFQTGNEEFAKGIPLCLPEGARITSSFAGHYDLAAYLVLIIPIFLATILAIKNKIYKILFSLLTLSSITLLIFTASRISFIAYLIGSVTMFILFKKKKYILPLVALSIVLLLIFSGSTAKRFMETFRLTSVVTNNQGQVIGQASLPDNLKNKISNNILENVPSQNLPAGSGFLSLPQFGIQQKTDKAIVQSSLSIAEAKRLKLENGGVEISTLSGSFLVKKVLVYDISFTTRFQAEWPTAWGAFLRNPLLGSGFATITLAADNDYLRALGESGLLGLFSFIFIFILFYIALKETIPKINDNFSKSYLLGIAGGIIGLFVNAVLIDVFEASKVGETFWILFGIAVGVIYLYKKEFDFLSHLKKIFTSRIFIVFYLFFLLLLFYLNSTVNFFVADDFTWLKWAANSTVSTIPHYFINSDGFFYRPFTKTVVFFLYTLFSFQPQGYHLFTLIIHFLIAVGVFALGMRIFANKLLSFLAALIFLFIPSQGENIFWISSLSANLPTLLITYMLLSWIKFRDENSKIFYIIALGLALLAFLSYEMSIIIFPLLILFDIFVTKVKLKNNKAILSFLPFLLITIAYPFIRQITNTLSIGGDYSYNLVHLIPNYIGNLLGYFGLFMFGESFLPFYRLARASLRGEMVLVGIFLVILFITFVVIAFFARQKLKTLLRNENIRIPLFLFLFSFISLIPFLGLGNLSERFSYLASIGFSLLFILILNKLTSFSKIEKFKNYILIFIVAILSIWYFHQINVENLQWHEAGRITNRTLAYLRLYYDGNHHNANFYFINPPIRKAEAWIFPVGLNDGIWFIYRDDSIKIYKLSSISEGKQILNQVNKKSKNFVFAFDKNGNIYEIK